jgi:hypothetical protein
VWAGSSTPSATTSVEGIGQADDALHDGQVARVVEHVAHEGLVDLQHVGAQVPGGPATNSRCRSHRGRNARRAAGSRRSAGSRPDVFEGGGSRISIEARVGVGMAGQDGVELLGELAAQQLPCGDVLMLRSWPAARSRACWRALRR